MDIISKRVELFVDLDQTLTDRFFMVDESKFRRVYDLVYEIAEKSFDTGVDTMFKDVYEKFIDDEYILAMFLLGGIIIIKCMEKEEEYDNR